MSDLRRSATAVKRNRSHKAKWAHGARQYGRNAPLIDKWSTDSAGPVRLRPMAAASSATTIALKRYNESNIKSVQHANDTHLRHDVAEALTSSDSSSSSDEVIVGHDGVGVVFHVEVDVDDDNDFSAYAVSGNNVLATAVQKAELKYENQVTEKLAKEYEFVPRGEEHATGYTADVDDDFEIIGHDSV